MKRGVLIDATGAGKVVFEIELGLEYSNSLGSKLETRFTSPVSKLKLP